jgi:outer membrane protein TolC
LLEFQELYDRELVSQIQVDQVFQDYQSGRIAVLASEQALANSLDAFKFQLGLPPRVELQIDEALLAPFELNDPRLVAVRDELEALQQEIVQFLPPEVPPRAFLVTAFDRYANLQQRLQDIYPGLERDLAEWTSLLDEPREGLSDEIRIDLEQQEVLASRLRRQLDDLRTELVESGAAADAMRLQLEGLPEAEGWTFVAELIGTKLREQADAMFIAQNQVRLFLIELQPFEISEEEAVAIALSSRLDLMNERARVTDAFRRVEVAADALEADLDVSGSVTLGTDPDRLNPLRFDSSANRYEASLEFDGPLNRFAERNAYRTAQLAYQEARRSYMAAEDSVINQVRADLRRLRISRLNFQISRQQLISATRQVDEAQFQLRTSTSGDSSLARDLLQALQGLLAARNGLINSWIDYEVGRIRLFVDLELLYLDDEGNWLNEAFNPEGQTDRPAAIDDPGGEEFPEIPPPSDGSDEIPDVEADGGLPVPPGDDDVDVTGRDGLNEQ